jgi:hypothetical protein
VYWRDGANTPAESGPVEWLATDGTAEFDVTVTCTLPDDGEGGVTIPSTGMQLPCMVECDDADAIGAGKQLFLITETGHSFARSVGHVFVSAA